jgi:chaperonin cofactor prefoldin
MKSKTGVRFIFDEKGKKTGVLIRIKQFEKLMQELEDLKDLATVYERTGKKFKPIPYEKIRKELFGNAAKK